MDIGADYSHLYANKIIKNRKKVFTDGLSCAKRCEISLSELQDVMQQNHENNISALLLGGERTDFFVTQDSRKYGTSFDQQQENCRDIVLSFDSAYVRYVKKYTVGEMQYRKISLHTARVFDTMSQYRAAMRISMSPLRMYQVSLGGAMIVGMVSMSMIYKNLGANAFAQDAEDVMAGTDDKATTIVLEDSKVEPIVSVNDKNDDATDSAIEKNETIIDPKIEAVAVQEAVEQSTPSIIMADIVAKENTTEGESGLPTKEVVTNSIDSAVKAVNEDIKEIVSTKSLEELAQEVTAGHPIEKMLPYILEQDPEVAKYLIAISVQESGMGEHVPVLDGQDCYNYWGYRSVRKLMGTGGHTCFNSRQDAVESVGKRIHELIYEYDRKTASRLVVWKCGSTCDGHSQESVDRWINVVDSYHSKLSTN